MLIEIPDVVCMGELTFNLENSKSYYENDSIIEESCCLALFEAFESLLRDNYKSFILTIIIYTVAIFETRDDVFKVFDSHSRDCTGMNDPCGACVLIEVSSLEDRSTKSVRFIDIL